MSFITMSADLVKDGCLYGLFKPTATNIDNTYPDSYSLFCNEPPGTGKNGSVRLFSGTMPSSSSLSSYGGSGNTYSGGLVTFGFFGGDLQQYDELIIDGDKVKIRSKVTRIGTASASGTATWFMWYLYSPSSSNYLNDKGNCFVGDVTGPGGGGALEIDNVSIVNGKSYYIKNFSFVIPRAWSFI